MTCHACGGSGQTYSLSLGRMVTCPCQKSRNRDYDSRCKHCGSRLPDNPVHGCCDYTCYAEHYYKGD